MPWACLDLDLAAIAVARHTASSSNWPERLTPATGSSGERSCARKAQRQMPTAAPRQLRPG
eukprot:3068111-Lingulodinium_polyedra.AAC.1